MADLLFVTGDMGGNVQPALGVASSAQALGHRVRVIGHEQLRAEVGRHGLDFVPYTSTKSWDSVKTQSPLRWVPMLNDRGIATDVTAECARRRPDVAIVDCLLYPGHQAVDDLGIARVVFSHTFREYIDRTRKIQYFGASTPAYLYGHRPARLWDSAELNLVTTLRDLDPARKHRQPSNVEWTGAVLPPARPAVSVAGDVPHVLVSMSTNGYPGQRAILRRIIHALGKLPVQATVTTAGVVDPASLPQYENVESTGYADHSEIMPKCSLLIGHGGHSTTFRALSHGIPVLVIPAYPLLDQRMVGCAVRDAGVGGVLRRWASASMIGSTAQKLLTDSEVRGRAEELGGRLRADDGAARAAERISEVAERVAGAGQEK